MGPLRSPSDACQGFLLSKPVQTAKLLELLRGGA